MMPSSLVLSMPLMVRTSYWCAVVLGDARLLTLSCCLKVKNFLQWQQLSFVKDYCFNLIICSIGLLFVCPQSSILDSLWIVLYSSTLYTCFSCFLRFGASEIARHDLTPTTFVDAFSNNRSQDRWLVLKRV